MISNGGNIQRRPRRVAAMFVFVGLGVIAALAPLIRPSKKDAPPAPPDPPIVGVITVRVQTMPLTMELPGRVVARETAEVRPQVNGIILKRFFEEGTRVSEGQILYGIEDAHYRATVASRRGRVAEAKSVIQSAQSRADRADTLLSKNAISREDMEFARDAYGKAQAVVASQQGELDAAQIELDFTQIRAPISGRIGRSFATVGALVRAGQPEALAIITRTDEVYVDVSQSADELLSQSDSYNSGGLSKDQELSAKTRLILPTGREYEHNGTVRFSETVVDPTTGSVTVRALFPNPEGKLLPGMAVRAILIQGLLKNAILVPQQGVTRDGRGRGVALVVDRENRVVQRIVTANRAVGNQWLVTAGLAAEERLIVDGLMSLRPGQIVRPVAPQSLLPNAPTSGGDQ